MDSRDHPAFALLLLGVLIWINAVHYGFGAALQEVRESWLEEKTKEGDQKAKQLLEWKTNPAVLTQTIYAVCGASYLLLGMALTGWGGIGFEAMLRTASDNRELIYWGSIAVNLFLAFVLMVSLGWIVPKIVAVHRPKTWTLRCCRLIRVSMTLMRPFTYVISALSGQIARLFGVDPHKIQDDVTEEEIISMVHEGHEQGVFLASEAEMIQNIFEFGDKEARDIMIHRKHITALDAKKSFGENLAFMLESGYSRFPVYLENMDEIIGIIHLKDAMKIQMENRYADCPVKDIPNLIRPAVLIPETRNIHELFKSMQLKRIQMVIVLDEYGQTAGLVAMEDILEEIVGNIEDEYDEEEALIERIGENAYLMRGLTPLEDVEEALNIRLGGEYETLNGFLIDRMDKVPEEDDHSEIAEQGYSFQILSVANKIIDKVKVTKLPQENAAQKEETEKE